jgi:hypothetical protein
MNVVRGLALAVLVASTAHADLAITPVGFANGDDWEPAIAVDGSFVYVAWPHYGAPTQPDSSGATCKTKRVTSWMYFQRSSDGGTTWQPLIIPRCPVSGTQIDAQVVVGPNHRVYVSYMDGPQANSSIQVIYSDDHGTTWSSPASAAGAGGGDKDVLLVDGSGGVLVAFEHLASQYVAYSPNVATTAFTQSKLTPPLGAGNGTSLATGGARDSKGNAYYVWTDATGNAKADSFLWISRSSDNYKTFTTQLIDRSKAASSTTGAGWDYWGASIQLGVIPKATGNDRLVAIYNASSIDSGAQRIYTKYSDTNGASWNIPYSATAYPNGTELSAAPAGSWHGFASIAGTPAGVRVLWQDNRVSPGCTSSTAPGQCGLWNNYTRTSADGVTWTPEVKTQLLTTHTYQVATPAPGGFFHPYGDYTWMASDGTTTWVVFGEGASYNGPGTIYVAKP